MSLLADIQAEYHQDLLENGNLKGKLLPKSSLWTGAQQWTSDGYLARVLHQTCQCGASLKLLTGVFHVEISPSGTRKEQRLDDSRIQLPLHGTQVQTTTQQVKLCALCIEV